jgi:hypothetical protein
LQKGALTLAKDWDIVLLPVTLPVTKPAPWSAVSLPVTIAIVAQEAGVSKQSISRALNIKGEISETTRQHVLDVIRRLGYRPSSIARGLVTHLPRRSA